MKGALMMVFLVAVLAQGAVARLWNTEAQIEKRYGAPTKKIETNQAVGNLYTYQYKQFQIVVTYVNGQSEMERYIHAADNQPLTRREISYFLSVNCFGGRWVYDEFLPVWVLGNFKAMAMAYSKVPELNKPGLAIYTAAYGQQHHLKLERPSAR
jgi:hypothetical protein